MSSPTSDLEPPLLLLAMPQVLDPYFHQSVILLVHHDDEGSYGFILNRATGIQISEILEGMDIDWQGPSEAMAHFGGPVQPQLGSVLCSTDPETPTPVDLEASELAPGILITQHIGDLERLADQIPSQFRLFLGYSGWGEGQLMEEILRNDWLTAPFQTELVFGECPEEVWEDALRSVGVEAASLPTWTPNGSGDAN
ncbi:MAG: YqgE/AlgH family protein [Deltaproteobacteria bacterium]|nr:YqgE/AlgH family protein [Deltaproteobacteria bacterium]